MPASTRRVLGALVAASGIVLVAVGAWIVVLLGPSGAASFTATSKAPGAIVVTSDLLDSVDAPVRVTAQRRDGGEVLLAVAPSTDARSILAGTAVSTVSELRYPAGTMNLRASGAGVLNDPGTADIWRLAARGVGSVGLLVNPGSNPGSNPGTGPETLVVTSGDGTALTDVTVTLTWVDRVWFFEALAAATLGAVIAAFALNDLWQGRATLVHGDVAQTADSEATR